MVITVRFFARIRETLGTDVLRLERSDEAVTVGVLARQLAERGPQWQEMLLAPNTLAAVNGRTVDAYCPVADGDEVAFFPPVTGG